MQSWVDAMSAVWQSERAATQMTLGQLIEVLSEFDPNRLVIGFGRVRSYRGYYSDLAFEPVESHGTVASLLHMARECLGRTFQGYKGGDYVMGESTPLWFSEWGEASGLRLMGLQSGGELIAPLLSPEYDQASA